MEVRSRTMGTRENKQEKNTTRKRANERGERGKQEADGQKNNGIGER